VRVLVATDGSPAAAVGVQPACRIADRAGGEIRIAAVVPSPTELLGAPWTGAEGEGGRALAEGTARSLLAMRLHQQLQTVPDHLSVSTAILEGHPAEAIVAEALRWAADLVVVGARGHGALESIVLGSTSEEVVDRSPVPVLVARTPAFDRIVLAVDGSAAATAGVNLLATPLCSGLRVWVVDVAPTAHPWWIGMSAVDAGNFERLLQLNEEAGAEDRAAAEAATSRLRAVGIEANSCHRIGDPAAELVRATHELGADTIVIGSRGQTGLSRLVLGSVTRQVLRHSPASVLVVHAGSQPWTAAAPPERRPSVATATATSVGR
jgi:nucleotide-binding universal stress UspA family protein